MDLPEIHPPRFVPIAGAVAVMAAPGVREIERRGRPGRPRSL